MERRRFLAQSPLALAAVSTRFQIPARGSPNQRWQPDGARASRCLDASHQFSYTATSSTSVAGRKPPDWCAQSDA